MTPYSHSPTSSSTCMDCFKRLFHKIKNTFRRNQNNKYQTKRKNLNSRLILGDDY